ncbi:hypothetical protein BDN72DRAFT_757716 [Pluteus cervinus]|uniref:Uncharacterized protein n=1 Tax=Pluteus cervinus TaxID=181527 RepID=A0ACD3BCI6_9AGAR|nr:hypothetical protein BDN72DRAFT_757716 [Pluteus cervinus]
MQNAAQTSTPLRQFAYHTTTTCAIQASVYGKCIVATYTDVKKDTCKAEFDNFSKCLQDAVRPLPSNPRKSLII